MATVDAVTLYVSDVYELEARLFQALGMQPVVRDAPVVPASPPSEFRHLATVVKELRHQASLVGEIPEGYPHYINAIMRMISAVLPWYTRPLREFSQKTAETLTVLSETVEALAHKQDRFEMGILGSDAGVREPLKRA